MATDLSATNVPEIWAANSIDVQSAILVMGRLVHTDFSSEVAQFGDVINTRKPVKGTARQWTQQSATDDIADLRATIDVPRANNIPVTLDQHWYNAFIEEDRVGAMSIEDIREQFIRPYMTPLGEKVDRTIVDELIGGTDGEGNSISELQVTGDSSGDANDMLVADDVIALMEQLNVNQCPMEMRRLVLGVRHHAEALKDSLFVQADQSGTTVALEQARLQTKFGFETFMSQNVPENTDGPQSVAFHRNAVAYATRPLKGIPSGAGAVRGTAAHEGYTASVTSAFSIELKGMVVMFDVLWGTRLLDAPLGVRIVG